MRRDDQDESGNVEDRRGLDSGDLRQCETLKAASL